MLYPLSYEGGGPQRVRRRRAPQSLGVGNGRKRRYGVYLKKQTPA
jgi:hypothetical protein